MKILLLSFALLILALPLLHADSAPPGFQASIRYDMSPAPKLLNTTLWGCSNSDCSDAKLLESRPDPCNQDGCFMTYYQFPKYLQLQMQFSDQNRTSNSFVSQDRFGQYSIEVRANDLFVEPAPLPPAPACFAAPAAALALILSLAYFTKKENPSE